MKLSTFVSYSLSTFMLLSCSQMRASEKPKAARKEIKEIKTRDLTETVALDDEDLIKKKGADNHELADADADEEVIKKEVGGTEIDEELPGSEKEGIPYSKDFLSRKNTKRMEFWVEYFTKHQRERFQRFINNGEEYRHHIEKIFEEQGVPKELYFVGLIESGYYLSARSHAAAVGPWQFIKGTAKRYGLKITNEVDERRDLFKATRAAAMYFKDMHNVFSSWELALAGYNAGEYGIIRRIMKFGTRDFYRLSRNKQLPSETINYVPKVLAAMHVVNNAEKYGFIIPSKKHHIFDRTELRVMERRTPLKTVARRLGIGVDLIKRLNPELKVNSVPRFAGTYYLRVPQTRYQETFVSKALPVTVEPETVAFAPVRPEKRSEINRRTATVQNLKLKLNGKVKLVTKVEPKIKSTNRPIVYKVKRGDNLTDLARVFNIKLAKLKKANKLRRGSIVVGQKIVLPDSQKGIYVVRKGDHLHKVARELNQPVQALVKLNALKRNKIYPGQKLIVNMD